MYRVVIDSIVLKDSIERFNRTGVDGFIFPI